MPEHNPWKTLSSTLLHENPWFSVREDDVIRPDNQPGKYFVVETRLATGVVAVTTEEEVYLVGQYRYPLGEYSWEIPEGGAEPGEAGLVTAKRELREETGVVANEWEQLGPEIHLSNCFSAEKGVLFLARDLQEKQATPDGTEVLKIKKLLFSEALELVHRGEIKDTMSIVGLLRAERVLGLKR